METSADRVGVEGDGRPRLLEATATTAEIEIATPSEDEEQAGARFALVVYTPGYTTVARLSEGSPLVVGRCFPSHVQIEDPRISRQHARFVVCSDAVQVEDLASRNGTRVNGARVDRATLSLGDEVQLGSVRIALAMRRPEPEAAAQSRTAIVVRNPRVAAIYDVARRAARADVPVLVLGETGTGKEHLARTIHLESLRAAGPWRAVNCSAIPASLVESTLFGFERGAFTGAERQSKGLFEEAAGGTVFLDEIAELALPAQAALLRVLESKTFHRVGSNQERRADVRVVAATHCNLEAAVAAGVFRKDLFYRINTVTLELPPLRARLEELEPLIERFLAECRRQWGVAIEGLEPEALARVRRYGWPGNIRQLRNAIERAALVAPLRQVRVEDLPPFLRDSVELDPAPGEVSCDDAELSLSLGDGLKPCLREYETRMIRLALAHTGGNRLAAAKLLRLPRRTLYRRLQALGLLSCADADTEDADDAELGLELD